MERTTRGSMADQILDELLPEEIEWERLVRTYPIPALLLAAAGGFLLGRARGAGIIAALSTFAAGEVAESVNQALGRDVV